MDETSAGFMLALFAALLVGIGLAVGAEMMRNGIEDECQRFGETNIRGTQYVCTPAPEKGKGESQ